MSFSSDPLYILAVLLASAALAEWLAHRRGFRRIGGALIVIILVAVLANIGVVPTFSADPPPIYGQLLSVGAPVAIFLLLLDVHLAALKRAGGPMLLAFGLGAAGTFAGVMVSGRLTGVGDWLGELAAPFQGMFVATYTGGSANFNALALHYDVMREGVIYAGANAVDNTVTAFWMAALLVLPGLIRRCAPARAPHKVFDAIEEAEEAAGVAPERPDLFSLAVLLALAFGAHWLSVALAEVLAAAGFAVPSILVLTTLALVLAQVPAVQRLQGAQILGTYGSYLFLAVIGAFCDFAALAELGRLGLQLVAFVGLAVLIHGLVVFGGGFLLKADPDVLAIASTANVGGSTTVLPLARSLRRDELLLPGILVGSLGNGIGTYLGFLAVRLVA